VNSSPLGRARAEALDVVGDRLRQERIRAGLSQRELASRLGLSASMISQVENGICRPSVATLWSIVTELNLSLDSVIGGDASNPVERTGKNAGFVPVFHPEERQRIKLASGVEWEDLIRCPDDGVDFVLITYEAGGASTPDGSLMKHRGREYGYVMAGTLGVQIGVHEYVLQPGDSIAFDSARLHRLYNIADTQVRALWCVLEELPHASPRSIV